MPMLEDFNPGGLQPIHAVYVGKPGQLPVRTRAVLDFPASHVELSHAEQMPAGLLPGGHKKRAWTNPGSLKTFIQSGEG